MEAEGYTVQGILVIDSVSIDWLVALISQVMSR